MLARSIPSVNRISSINLNVRSTQKLSVQKNAAPISSVSSSRKNYSTFNIRPSVIRTERLIVKSDARSDDNRGSYYSTKNHNKQQSTDQFAFASAAGESWQMGFNFGSGGAILLVIAGLLFLVNKDDEKVEAAEQIAGVPGTDKERTFIAIKPDGVQRGLIGEIINRFEKKGYKLVAIKSIQPTEAFAKEHYADLSNKPFFPSLVKYFSSGPVVAMVWEGKNVIATGRKLIGATNPAAAEPGSIRGDLCIEMGRNIIHGSDSKEAAHDEINLWFKSNEIADYKRAIQPWISESKE